MIVVDASALVHAVANTTAQGRRALSALAGGATAPHLIDAEVGQTIRNLVVRRRIDAAHAARSLERAHRLVTTRVDHGPLLARAWELRDNVSFYDALYVAAAESLGLPLLTADAGLAAAMAARCRIDVV